MPIALLIGGPEHGRRIEIPWVSPCIEFPILEPLRAIDFSSLTKTVKDSIEIKTAQYFLYDDCPIKYVYKGSG